VKLDLQVDLRGIKVTLEHKVLQVELREHRELKETRDIKDIEEPREHRGFKVARGLLEHKVLKDIRVG
jgi:hypothetical protein